MEIVSNAVFSGELPDTLQALVDDCAPPEAGELPTPSPRVGITSLAADLKGEEGQEFPSLVPIKRGK